MNDEIMQFLVGSTPPPRTPSSFYEEEESPSRTTPQSTGSRYYSKKKSTKSIKDAFYKTLKQDWIESDDIAFQVVKSIANLRERLWQGSYFFHCLQEEADSQDDEVQQLQPQDITLMLDHDLLQHEKMLSHLRRQLAAMAQAQEALGRRLEEWSCQELDDVQDAWDLFKATSRELYRKQVLAQQVWNARSGIGILYQEDTVTQDEENNNSPRQVARLVVEKWSRKHSESHLRLSVMHD